MEGHDASRTVAWTRLDSLALVLIGLAGALLRFVRLGSPKDLVFDEIYYVPDACRYVIRIADICGPREFTYFHPPLGKWLIAFGMQVLGPTRFGWRIVPALFGAATVVLLYVLARYLLNSTVGASIAALALAIDPLHFVHSRIALLDVFLVFFVVAMFAALLVDRHDPSPGIFGRQWLAAAGIAGGAAVATKWSGAALLLTAIALAAARAWSEGTERRKRLFAIGLWLIAVPAVVYLVSYAGRIEGPLLAWPWAEGSWVQAFFERQGAMLSYHTAERGAATLVPHQYSSPAWSWFLLKRPMSYFFRDDTYREIMGTGNPVVWWPALIAIGYLTWRAYKGRDRDPAIVILAGFAAAYLPWFVLTLGSQDPYFFYVLPALPFLYLAVGAAGRMLWARAAGRVALAAFGVLAAGSFYFLLPVLTAQPLTRDAWEARMLFKDCEARFEELEGDPPLPNRTARHTWCWI